MSDQNLNKNLPGQPEDQEPVILRNEYGEALDPTVVIDEADRTVMLTENETIVIEKEHLIDIAPKNRPRKVYGGMFGPVEIGVLGAGMLAVLGAVLLYAFFVVPSNRELENNRTRLDRLEKDLASAKEKYGNMSNVETQVAKLLTSVSDFESRYLPVPTNGRTALYQKINGLIASYGLVNSTGPDYAPLEILDDGKEKDGEERGGKSKFRSFFPGVYVSMTVEGPYTNLRRFIREIETGSEFVVISAVELEPSDSQQEKPDGATQASNPSGGDLTTNYPAGIPSNSMSVQPAGQGGLPNSSRGKTHGSVVSLKLEMAAYFRRPNAAPAPVDSVQQ
ncbi:MAG: hypothetical protein HOP17_14740 [Acidobacteria bacterium]|nr:hypothetical protein [Acidobacteriota bacterium]